MAYPKNARKADRVKRANERQEARSKRTNAQQIAVLDTILGKGVGAKKERARLSK